MRYIRTVIFLSFFPAVMHAQSGNVGIGTSQPDSTARLDVSSTTQGFLPPRMTAAQRSAIKGPAAGLTVFQTDGNKGMFYFDGGIWRSLLNGKPVDSSGFPPDYAWVSSFVGGFTSLTGITIDPSGTLYVASNFFHTIWRIQPNGLVSTLAGTVSPGDVDSNGTNASFNAPYGIAADRLGNIYVADYNNHKIRKITQTGIVTTYAGTGTWGHADGSAASAQFTQPAGITVDAVGNVYVSEVGNQVIRKITPAGIVSTIAGDVMNFGSADGTGSAASFHFPTGLAIDKDGNILVADRGNCKIRKVTPAGVVTTVAGTGNPAYTDGAAATAEFFNPTGLIADSEGNTYVADGFNHRIRRISPAGIVSTLAGDGTRSNVDGPGSIARYSNPFGVVLDAAGNLYTVEFANSKVRRIVIR